MSDITVLSDNRIVIRTPSVWYMVGIEYVEKQLEFSKNPIFKRAYDLAKRKYKVKDKQNDNSE